MGGTFEVGGTRGYPGALPLIQLCQGSPDLWGTFLLTSRECGSVPSALASPCMNGTENIVANDIVRT